MGASSAWRIPARCLRRDCSSAYRPVDLLLEWNCGRYYIGWHSSYNFDWTSSFMYLNQSLATYPVQTKYLYSIYFVITTMSSVGYGDILAKNPNGELASMRPVECG